MASQGLDVACEGSPSCGGAWRCSEAHKPLAELRPELGPVPSYVRDPTKSPRSLHKKPRRASRGEAKGRGIAPRPLADGYSPSLSPRSSASLRGTEITSPQMESRYLRSNVSRSPAASRPDTTLIPPGTQYGATQGKAEKGNPYRYAGIARPCTPLQRLSDHS